MFEIFGQTFRITGVLRGIAVVVAVIGIFLTLTTLVSERAREIGVLRAIGASRGQVQGVVLVESALIGFLSSVLGLVAGLALSLVLTYVINKAFFGWTIQLSVPWLDGADDADLDHAGGGGGGLATSHSRRADPHRRSGEGRITTANSYDKITKPSGHNSGGIFLFVLLAEQSLTSQRGRSRRRREKRRGSKRLPGWEYTVPPRPHHPS